MTEQGKGVNSRPKGMPKSQKREHNSKGKNVNNEERIQEKVRGGKGCGQGKKGGRPS